MKTLMKLKSVNLFGFVNIVFYIYFVMQSTFKFMKSI